MKVLALGAIQDPAGGADSREFDWIIVRPPHSSIDRRALRFEQKRFDMEVKAIEAANRF